MNHALERLDDALFEPLHPGAAAAITGGLAPSSGHGCYIGWTWYDGEIFKDYEYDPD